jgi:hypothetical protein
MSSRTGIALLALLGFVMSAHGAAAQTTATNTFTFSPSQYASEAGARGIVTADFDNDGAPDFATANAGSNTVDVFMNRQFTGGGFTVKRYAVGTGPFDITWADFNFDGFPDLAVAAADADEIDVLFGGVGGNFSTPMRIPAPGNPRGIAAAYLGFGGYSIVYSSYRSGTVSLLTYSYESKTFVPGPTMNAGANPQGIAIGYFKARLGYPDIAVANAGGSRITIFEGNSDNTYTRTELNSTDATNMNVLVAADFNKDGRVDLAAASTGRNSVSIFLGSSTNGLQWAGKLSGSTIASPRGLAAADLNADGRPELIVANRSTSGVTIFIANGSGPVFSTHQIVKSGSGARAVAAADFDGDGRIDIATANEYASSGTVLWNRTPGGGGTGATDFEQRPLPDITAGAWTMGGPYVAADFNNNGIPDIVVGDGVVLDAKTPMKIDVGRKSPGITNAFVGDFNEDGNTDLVQTTYYTLPDSDWQTAVAIDVLLGDGTGHFRLAWSLPIEDPYGAVAADFDGDGHTDLVLGAGYGSGTVRTLYFGRGDGTFTEGPHTSAPSEALRDVADANGDGHPDLFVWHGIAQQMIVYLGDGAGGFPSSRRSQVIGNSYYSAIVDLDSDGVPDVLAVRGASIVTLMGIGDGSFDTPLVSDLPKDAYNFAVGDFTGDGHPDLLTSEGSLAVGHGDGTFGMNRNLNIAFERSVTCDLDRDGLADLVLGTSYYTAMALYNRTAEQPNMAPVAKVWPSEMDVPFVAQFDEEGLTLIAGKSYDPNLDPLSYTWLENERVVGTGNTFYLNVPSGTHVFTLVVRDNAGAESRVTARVTIQPYEEIVFHTGWMASPNGAWMSGQEDSTAADGVMDWHPNANAPKIEQPLANPANYLTIGFPADPNQEYKLWIRMKAQGNSPYNDSVFVQFDDAVDSSGAPVYMTGTTSALSVNLEECSGCGLSGWGWRDEGWGARDIVGTVTLRFPANRSLWHQLRIQTREDGVMIDQIVLSANKYKRTRPGAVKNDTTILLMTVPWE